MTGVIIFIKYSDRELPSTDSLPSVVLLQAKPTAWSLTCFCVSMCQDHHHCFSQAQQQEARSEVNQLGLTLAPDMGTPCTMRKHHSLSPISQGGNKRTSI